MRPPSWDTLVKTQDPSWKALSLDSRVVKKGAEKKRWR
jgi:hypothetical protein